MWRPAIVWAFIAFWVAVAVTAIAWLWLKLDTIEALTPIILTLLASGGTAFSLYTHGRTREKIAGVQTDYTQQNGVPYEGEEVN